MTQKYTDTLAWQSPTELSELQYHTLETQRSTPWFVQSFNSLFSHTRTADPVTSTPSGVSQAQPTLFAPATDRKVPRVQEVMTLTPDTHCDLNHELDQLLHALRSHATTLFRVRILKQSEVWELNKKLTQMLDFVKHLMPLQTIPWSQVTAFMQHYQTLTALYEDLHRQYQEHAQTASLVEDWQGKVVARINELNTFFEALRTCNRTHHTK